MDDVVVESVAAGAIGWIAGLVNAFPEESVRLFQLAQSGPSEELDSLYAWFLPLLRLDTVPKFVQLIKQVQQECGGPSARVRPPRLELAGTEREEVIALTRRSLASAFVAVSDLPPDSGLQDGSLGMGHSFDAS